MSAETQRSANAVPPQAGRREWIGLAVLALACLLYAMDLTVLHLAVPSLSADLQPTSAQLLWIVDIYGFMVAGCLITMGTLGDRIGRRRLLMIGGAAFAAVSVLAAFSTSAEMLIAARALQGIAGATLAPSTLSLIFSMFLDPRQRSIAIGVWIAGFSAGGAIGPVLGGVLLESFWWGSVFLLALPVMALLLVLGPRLLPEYRDPNAGRLDPASAALSLVAILAVIFGLKEIAQDGLGLLPVSSVVAGLAVGVVFVRRQRSLEDPMIDVRLFKIRAFNASLTTNVLGIFIVIGYFLFVAQYLQLVLGLSPLQAGLWSLPSACGFIVGSIVGPRILRRVRPAPVIGGRPRDGRRRSRDAHHRRRNGRPHDVGRGPRWSSRSGSRRSSRRRPTSSSARRLPSAPAPPPGSRRPAPSSAGRSASRSWGASATAIYRSELADLMPAGVPAGVAAVARDTLGAAVGVAERLPGELGAALVESARAAFIQGMRVSSAIATVVAIAIAALAVVTLRHVGSGADRETALEEAADQRAGRATASDVGTVDG